MDLVSRQYLLDEYDRQHKGPPGGARKIIEEAPAVRQWIPCSERMPTPRVDVWVCSDMGQMVAYYDEFIGTWYGRDYLELIVSAWRPLPEPYKGEQDGAENKS